MASAIAHLAPPLALIAAFAQPAAPRRLWILGALLAVAPDVDVVGFALGIPYAAPLGHRGLTHSLPFAAACAAFLAFAAFPPARGGFSRARAFLYLFLAGASHGVLDAATNGGLGVAFLAPFSDGRFFFPVRPIEVSPLGLARFFTARGAEILANEAIWVGVPCAVLALAGFVLRRRAAEPAR